MPLLGFQSPGSAQLCSFLTLVVRSLARKALQQLGLVESQASAGRSVGWFVPVHARAVAADIVGQAAAAGALAAEVPQPASATTGTAAATAPEATAPGTDSSGVTASRKRGPEPAAAAAARTSKQQKREQQERSDLRVPPPQQQEQQPAGLAGGAELVGRAVFIFWPEANAHFRGIIRSFNAATG